MGGNTVTTGPTLELAAYYKACPLGKRETGPDSDRCGTERRLLCPLLKAERCFREVQRALSHHQLRVHGAVAAALDEELETVRVRSLMLLKS